MVPSEVRRVSWMTARRKDERANRQQTLYREFLAANGSTGHLDSRADCCCGEIRLVMIAFVYRCPATGLKVQGHLADELLDGETYESVTCTACGRVHLVNPKSGRVLEPAKK
jgi:hypothetical protein